ncbi:MAG TPA: cupin domain-containing protein [Candidatus Binataceae bacterium]
MSAPDQSTLDLTTTFIQLRDGPDAIPVPVDKDFWARIAERTDLHEGRLVTVGSQSADWTAWEMHPAGEEVLYLLSGALDLVLQNQNNDGERAVELRAGRAFIVPRGTWHRGIVRSPYTILSITYGAGTRHRAV